jgi:hypothetical protein
VRVTKQKHDIIDAVDADLLWAAACTAYRINSGYLKQPEMIGDQVVRRTNREIVKIVLADLSMITDADREHAKDCRRYMTNSTTMTALKGELSEWGQITARVCQLNEINSMYDLSVVTAMPQALSKAQKRENTEARLARCDPGPIGKVGEKIELAVEIIRNNYSAKFNTWFVSGITDSNHAVFFAYRESLTQETHVKIRGTVKRHTDSATQLNRVKLVGETK